MSENYCKNCGKEIFYHVYDMIWEHREGVQIPNLGYFKQYCDESQTKSAEYQGEWLEALGMYTIANIEEVAMSAKLVKVKPTQEELKRKHLKYRHNLLAKGLL